MDATSRDMPSISLPRWGRVAEGVGAVPWLVFDEEGSAVEPIRRFLVDLGMPVFTDPAPPPGTGEPELA